MLDDDDYEFPPTRYPKREAITMGLVIAIAILIGWVLLTQAWEALDVWF